MNNNSAHFAHSYSIALICYLNNKIIQESQRIIRFNGRKNITDCQLSLLTIMLSGIGFPDKVFHE